MAQFNDTAKLDGLFRTAYGDSIIDLLPDFAITQKTIKFASASQTPGKKFSQPVILNDEQGVTYVASNGGVQTLEDSVAGQVSHAEVVGSNIYLRSSLDYEAAARSAASANSFAEGTSFLVKRMTKSGAKRLEIASIYGGVGIGTIGTVSDSTGTNTLTVSAATWAGGIWNGMEGAKLDAYNGASKRNTNATLVVSSVTFSSRTVVVTGNSTDTAALAIGDVLYFRGSYGNEMLGLQKIATTSGTLFAIDNSVYSAFKGNTYAVGSAALTMAKVLAAADVAVSRGLMGDATLYVNPGAWTNLNSDQAALRMYDGSYKPEAQNGFEAITYHYSGGKIYVVAHPMVKQGDAFLFQSKSLKYIGSTKLTFDMPGQGGKIFLHIADKTGIEFRCMANMALFCEEPAHLVYLSGIVNS